EKATTSLRFFITGVKADSGCAGLEKINFPGFMFDIQLSLFGERKLNSGFGTAIYGGLDTIPYSARAYYERLFYNAIRDGTICFIVIIIQYYFPHGCVGFRCALECSRGCIDCTMVIK